MRAASLLVVVVGLVVAAACGGAPPAPAPAPVAAPVCAIPGAPVVLRTHGANTLERWDVPADPVLSSPALPADAGYAAYRAAIREAGAELERPIADPPQPRDDAEREIWLREEHNLTAAYSGGAGTIRPIHCLEAWFFARQHARANELTQPTEFGLAVAEKDGRLRLYFAGGDQMFVPKQLYPFTDIAADVAAGWRFTIMLHNHTIRTRDGKPALGVTAPSTADVQLMRGLVEELKLGAVWVTNGVYTIEIPGAALAHYVTRD